MQETNLAIFEPLKAEIQEVVATVSAITIITAEDVTKGTKALKDVQAITKKVEDLRKEIVGPYNDYVKQINALAKEFVAPVQEAKDLIKRKLVEFNDEQERIRKAREAELAQKEADALAKAEADKKAKEEEQKARLDEIERTQGKQARMAEEAKLGLSDLEGDETPENDELAKIQADRERLQKEQESKNVKGTRTVTLFEVTDPNLVPRAYCIVDEGLIREAVKAGVKEIPGVKVREETRVQ